MSTLIRRAALAALFLGSTAAVAAPAPTPQGAAAIRAGLEGWVADWLGGGSATVAFSAPIAVAAQGSFYAVKIPSLTATIAGSGGEAALTVAIDAIDLRLTPQSDSDWAVDWRVPSTIGVEGADGTGAEIMIGSQSGQGTYSTALGTFTAFDVRLGDIVAAPVKPRADREERIAIDSLAVTLYSDETAGGLWDAQGTLALRGLAVRDRDAFSDTKVTIGTLDGQVGATGLDVPALLAFVRGIAHVDLPADGGPDTGALGGVADLMDTTPKLLDTFQVGWSTGDFTSTDEFGGGNVGHAGAAVMIDGVRADLSSARVTADMAGLAISDVGAEDITPRLVKVDLTIDDVPSAVMTGALKDFFRSAGSMGPEAAFEMAAGQVYAALTRGDGVVRFDQILVDFPRLGIDLSGRVWTAESSMVGFAADMILTIGGYKALYDMIGATFGLDDGARQFVTAFELLGQPAVDTEGRPGRRYKFAIDETTGAVTFNGTNIESLIQ